MFQAALSPGNQSQDLGLISLALDLILFSYVFINPFPPQSHVLPDLSPFGLLFPQSFFGVIPRFMGPASQSPRIPALSAIPVSTVPHCLIPVCGLGRTPMLLLSIFLSLPRLASDNCTLPFLHPQYLCLGFWVHNIETNLEHLSQRIWRKTELNSSCKELRILFGHKSKHLIN